MTSFMDIGPCLHSFFSGRRCTCGWTYLHGTDLWQELELLLFFMSLGFFVCVCVCILGLVGVGGCVAFCGQVSISSFLAPLRVRLIAFSHMHTPPSTLCFGSPCSLLLNCLLPVPANTTCSSRSSFMKLSLPAQLEEIPPLTLHLPPLSRLVSLSFPVSLGLFLFPCWAMNSFRNRLCSIHLCVLCTTLFYLK